MNSNDQAATLNSHVTVRIAPSPIHGVGVFALRNMPKGRKMGLDDMPKGYNLPYSSFGKLFPEVKEILLERWPNVVEGSAFIYPDSRYQGYLNHSPDPNYDAVNDVLLKDVKQGEELTEDYRKIKGWEVAYPWLKDV